jgi:hypothetical protein
MPSGEFVPVTVPLYYEGHAYRAGSRIRVRVSAPNGDQPIWSFSETEPAGTAEVEIGYGPGMPSRLALPLVPGVDVPDQLPHCPGLRGEPCRDYVPFENATTVLDGYVRPKGATPILASLVPAYAECSSANRVHGGGLAHDSCNPVSLSSSTLTTGTPDANGAATNMAGSVRFDVCPVPGCAAPNIRIEVSASDVRCQTSSATTCGSSNAAGGTDYAGELRAELPLRITDRYNGSSLSEGATMRDTSFGVTIPCTPTSSDATKGTRCSIVTTANAVVSSSVISSQRAIWELGQIAIYDGGSDGDGDTTAGNQRFLSQGVFVP